MEAEETPSSEVVHVFSPVVADANHIVHESSSEGVVTNPAQIKLTGSHSISGRQVEEPAVEVDTSRSTLLGRFLNMEHFEKFIGFGLLVAPKMSGSSEKLRDLSLFLFSAILVVFPMQLWVMPSCKVKWKVIIFEIASNSIKLVCIYLLLCMLKPEWFSWCGFVIVCIIATVDKCSDELKTKFTWCCEKGVRVINYVIDNVAKPRKDQASPASPPPPPSASA